MLITGAILTTIVGFFVYFMVRGANWVSTLNSDEETIEAESFFLAGPQRQSTS